MAGFYNSKLAGHFIERDYGHWFDYRLTADPWALSHGLQHEIAVGQLGEIRFGNVLKTVAHVAVDEDENGHPVIEKWQIKNNIYSE